MIRSGFGMVVKQDGCQKLVAIGNPDKNLSGFPLVPDFGFECPLLGYPKYV